MLTNNATFSKKPLLTPSQICSHSDLKPFVFFKLYQHIRLQIAKSYVSSPVFFLYFILIHHFFTHKTKIILFRVRNNKQQQSLMHYIVCLIRKLVFLVSQGFKILNSCQNLRTSLCCSAGHFITVCFLVESFSFIFKSLLCFIPHGIYVKLPTFDCV